QVHEGQKVPAFELMATGNKKVQLPNTKATIVYFYPKDATPGCTVEGQDFTRLHEEFRNLDVEVFGLSRDTLKSHEKFKSKQNYSFDLLSDSDEKACSIFGVIKLKNMYGKQVRGIERSTFFIDSQGNLIKEWRGVQVPGHAEEVLNYIKNFTNK
ncbi:MAG: peroxiredoxin, partial [Bdellovibrionales bacterium]|nr:peroxiredoxin [Bdellovibrionales bacterium]